MDLDFLHTCRSIDLSKIPIDSFQPLTAFPAVVDAFWPQEIFNKYLAALMSYSEVISDSHAIQKCKILCIIEISVWNFSQTK